MTSCNWLQSVVLDSLLIVREDAPDAHRRPLERATLFFHYNSRIFAKFLHFVGPYRWKQNRILGMH